LSPHHHEVLESRPAEPAEQIGHREQQRERQMPPQNDAAPSAEPMKKLTINELGTISFLSASPPRLLASSRRAMLRAIARERLRGSPAAATIKASARFPPREGLSGMVAVAQIAPPMKSALNQPESCQVADIRLDGVGGCRNFIQTQARCSLIQV
jgi:hypothetical protein